MQIGIMDAVSIQVSPESRYPQHHTTSAVLRIILQEVNKALQPNITNIIRTVREADSPNSNQRFTIIKDISLFTLLIGHTQRINQIFPIIHQHGTIFILSRQTGQIIHHTNSTSIFGSRSHGVLQNSAPFACFRTGSSKETLHKHSVQPILLHPLKMQVYRTFIR